MVRGTVTVTKRAPKKPPNSSSLERGANTSLLFADFGGMILTGTEEVVWRMVPPQPHRPNRASNTALGPLASLGTVFHPFSRIITEETSIYTNKFCRSSFQQQSHIRMTKPECTTGPTNCHRRGRRFMFEFSIMSINDLKETRSNSS